MIRQDLIDEGLLPFKGFESAAVRDSIVIQGWVDDLREQFGGGAKAMSGSPIAAVQRLAEDKLANVGGVAEIEPVCDAASRILNFLVDQLTGRACIDAADHNVDIG